jgi:hypothetical protein
LGGVLSRCLAGCRNAESAEGEGPKNVFHETPRLLVLVSL